MLADHSLQAIPRMISFAKHQVVIRKNKVERSITIGNVKTSLNKRNGTVKINGSASVQKSKKQDDSDSVCVNSNDCMSSDNVCVSNAVNVVQSRAKPKKNKPKKDIWKPTGKVFTQIGYIWRPTGRTFTMSSGFLDSGLLEAHMTEICSNSPISSVNLVLQLKIRNDSSCKDNGFWDYQFGMFTISWVYYVEGLGHSLFSVGQFCDSIWDSGFSSTHVLHSQI
ncbi:hypothetical protein Tco_0405250 [Tanacetum coccineum]